MPDDLRYFRIPACGGDRWNPDVHGLEMEENDDGGSDYVGIGWRPGFYTFSSGSSGESFDFTVPESIDTLAPSQAILKGIHAYLTFAYD